MFMVRKGSISVPPPGACFRRSAVDSSFLRACTYKAHINRHKFIVVIAERTSSITVLKTGPLVKRSTFVESSLGTHTTGEKRGAGGRERDGAHRIRSSPGLQLRRDSPVNPHDPYEPYGGVRGLRWSAHARSLKRASDESQPFEVIG